MLAQAFYLKIAIKLVFELILYKKFGSAYTLTAYAENWFQNAGSKFSMVSILLFSYMLIHLFAPNSAVPGTLLMQQVAGMSLTERENVLVQAIQRGNYPKFLRRFQIVKTSILDAQGKRHRVEFRVMPDYLAVGTDLDFVRVPLTPMAAQRVADGFRCVLPTPAIVDAIYAQAFVKLEPHPMTEAREAVETFVEHNSIIERQRAEWLANWRAEHGGRMPLEPDTAPEAVGTHEPPAKMAPPFQSSSEPPVLLVAGIKKDVVQTPLLLTKPDRVAIYGWHKLDGKPIQPLTTIHRNTYVDYSHGIRLVERSIKLDGRPVPIETILQNPFDPAASRGR